MLKMGKPALLLLLVALAVSTCYAEEVITQKHVYKHHHNVPAPWAPRITEVSPNGQTYSELAQIFWQWITRYSYDSSPLAATNPLDCNVGRVGGGDVLVIGGVVGDVGGSFTTTRNCYLSKDIKSIFIPLLNNEQDNDGDLGELNKPGGFLSNATFNNGALSASFRELTKSVFLSVKSAGQDVKLSGWPHSQPQQTEFIKDNFFVVTPMFTLAGPKYDPTQYTPPPLVAATRGYYVLLDVQHAQFPLQLRFGGEIDLAPINIPFAFNLDITYNIYKPGGDN